MKLYSYWRSSAAYRVRIALHLKQISHEIVPVNLKTSEQCTQQWRAMNPQALVPVLETAGGAALTQSPAIIEWLEATHPEPALLPGNETEKAKVRAFALNIACEIHPLNNLRVLRYLQGTGGFSEAQKLAWYRHWVTTGFAAMEQQLAPESPFCFGNAPSLADIYLVPQVYNALRFDTDMTPFPKILAIYHRCNALSAFAKAAPEQQPDAV